MDTDSFIFHLKTDDVYRDIAEDVEKRFFIVLCTFFVFVSFVFAIFIAKPSLWIIAFERVLFIIGTSWLHRTNFCLVGA